MISTNIEPTRAAAIGMFDGVHRGHTALVAELAQLARERDMIPTIFTFDRHPLDMISPELSPMLLTTPMQRGQLLHYAGAEDVFVFVFNKALRDFTAAELLEAMRDHYGVRLLLLGYNHHFGHDRIENLEEYQELGRQCGIEVIRAKARVTDPETGRPISSTAIRACLGDGRMEKANEMLGHPYRLIGSVVHGTALGQQIGFPTANLSRMGASQMLPAEGVYSAAAVLPDIDPFRKYPAMVNIGRRPTVNESLRPELRVETHIIGFDGDIYGHLLDLRLLTYLRDERKFESVEALADQLSLDREAALKAFKEYKAD